MKQTKTYIIISYGLYGNSCHIANADTPENALLAARSDEFFINPANADCVSIEEIDTKTIGCVFAKSYEK